MARKRESWNGAERAERWLGRSRSRNSPRFGVTEVLEAKTDGEGEAVSPDLRATTFRCTFCAVFASPSWTNLVTLDAVARPVRSPIWYAICDNCGLPSYWLEGAGEIEARMLWPVPAAGPPPHKAMPEDVRGEYEEARQIASRSPRAAAALLRLALQKFMLHVGQPGEILTYNVRSLVRKGLDPRVQQALESLRVIGDGAIEPGELSPADDNETAQALFTVLNFLVEELIEVPRKRDAIYESLPEGARPEVENRDASLT